MYTTLEGGQIMRGLRNIKKSDKQPFIANGQKNTKINKDKHRHTQHSLALQINYYYYSTLLHLRCFDMKLINKLALERTQSTHITFISKDCNYPTLSDNVDKYLPQLGSYIHCLYTICALYQNHYNIAYYY